MRAGRIFFDLLPINNVDEVLIVILLCLLRAPPVHKRHVPHILIQLHVHLTLIQQPLDHLILLLELLLQGPARVEAELVKVLFDLDVVVDLSIVALEEDKLHQF